MNKGIIYKAVVKGKYEVTYFIKLDCCKKDKKTTTNYYKVENKIKHRINFETEFTSNLDLTYYVGKVLDFELNVDAKEIISVTDIMINDNLQNGDKK